MNASPSFDNRSTLMPEYPTEAPDPDGLDVQQSRSRSSSSPAMGFTEVESE
jgi:hypothetical protein